MRDALLILTRSALVFTPSAPGQSRPRRSLVLLGLGLCLAASLAGCGSADDPRIAQARQRLLLADEPADALSILDAKQQLADGNDVTLIGTIGGDPLSAPGPDVA